jgi:hypothetical protein
VYSIVGCLVTDVARLLDDIADGYARAHPDSLPTQLGQPWGGTRRLQPASKPPPGSSVYIRGQLVDVARYILDVHWKAGGRARPGWSGFGRNIGWRATVYQDRMTEPDSTVASVLDYHVPEPDDDDGEVRVFWRPQWHPEPHDVVLTPPSPSELRGACRAAQGRVETIRDPDVEHTVTRWVYAALRAVQRAGGDQEGARRIQHRNIQEDVNSIESCTERLKDGTRCGAEIVYQADRLCKHHYDQARYRRQKEDRERQQRASA